MGKAELTILEGKNRGEKFEFSKKSLTIGRVSDNNIILPDPAVSSHHCEIQSIGESFFIIDRDSSNGTWLNGREVGKAQLLPGDRIRVGDTTLVFSVPGRKAHRSALNVPDLLRSKRESPQPDGGTQEPPLRKVVAVILLAVLGIGAISILLRNVRRSPGVIPRESVFELDLVEEKSGFEGLCRSQISISAEGNMLFCFDDLGKGRHVYKEAKLGSGELRTLREKAVQVLSPGGRGLGEGEMPESFRGGGEGDIPENQSSSPAQGLITISVRVGSLEKEASYDGDLPLHVAALRDKLHMLRDKKFSFPSLELSGEGLIAKAKEAFAKGKLFFNEKEARSSNLFNSVSAFKEALTLLETVNPKPDFYANVEEYHYRSREELNSEFSSLRFQVEKAIKLMEWEKARDNLERILTKIPDRTDERYRYALRRLEKVRAKCRSTQ